MIRVWLDYPWIGVAIGAGIVGFWTWIFVYRHRHRRQIPSGEWILYAAVWIALAFMVHRALLHGK